MKTLNPVLVLIVILTLNSCDENKTYLPESNYFPIQNTEWKFDRLIRNAGDFEQFGSYTLRTIGTVTADGKIYNHVTSDKISYIDFEVRREGSEYFERNAIFKNGVEYKFLDSEKKVGESWSYIIENYRKVEYTVVSKEPTQKINGKTYRNVITIKVDHYIPGNDGTFEPWLSAEYVYVEGIGNVFSLVPYPLSLVYGDVQSTRTNNY